MDQVNIDQLFNGVGNLAYVSLIPPDPGAIGYWAAHPGEHNQMNARVQRAAVGGGIVAGAAVGGGIYVGAKTGALTGSIAGPGGAIVGGAAGAALGYFAVKEIVGTREESHLVSDTTYTTWRENEQRNKQHEIRKSLRSNLDKIILERGLVDDHYRCDASKNFMMYPKSLPDGHIIDQEVQTVHRPDENNMVHFNEKSVNSSQIVRDFFCLALRTDLLKLRYRFLEELMVHRRADLNPDRTQALRDLKNNLQTEFSTLTASIKRRLTNELRAVATNSHNTELTELSVIADAIKGSEEDRNYYPFADRQRNISAY